MKLAIAIVLLLVLHLVLCSCNGTCPLPDPGPSPIENTPVVIEGVQTSLKKLVEADANDADVIRQEAGGLPGEAATEVTLRATSIFNRIGQRLMEIAELSRVRGDVEAALERETKVEAINKANVERADKAEKELLALEKRWYVRWGRWLTRAFWFVVLGWGALGVFAAVFGLGSPLGWVGKVANFIGDSIPFTWIFRVLRAPFVWIRDWFREREPV